MLKDVILYNPADRTQRPKQTKYSPSIYGTEELKTLIKSVKGAPIEVPITLCCHYALRRGEVLGLQWKNVDFEKRIITICSSVVRAGKAIFQESTKTLSSNRILPMNDEIYNYLKEHKKRQKNNCSLFGNMYTKNDFVCTWDDGRPFSPEYLSHARLSRILCKVFTKPPR